MAGGPCREARAVALPSVAVVVAPERRAGEADPLRRALAAQTDRDFELLQPRCSFRQYGEIDPNRRVRVGPAIAMNHAAGRASADVLAFVAPDLEPEPGWIRAIRECLARPGAPDLVTGRTAPCLDAFTDAADAVLECTGARSGELGCPCALHFAIRRDAFVELGGFDESQPPAVLLQRPLGGLPLPNGQEVGTEARMVARGAPCGSPGGWLRRQWTAGRAARFSPRRPVRDQGRTDGSAARRQANRFVQRRADLAPVLALLPLGVAVRALGCVAAALAGGRRGRPMLSPLAAPRSPHVVGPEGRRPVATVIVPVHGCPEWFGLCLEALERQDFPEPYEILVSIECSDKAAAEFGRMFPHVRTIRCPAGAGPGGGRNVLLLAARGEYVAFTDDDCLAQCDWLRRLIAACRSRNGDPVRGWLGTAYPYSLVSRAQQAARLGPVRPRKPRLTAGLGGCNMCLARALIDRTGARFAEGVYGAEEIAFLQGLGVRRVLLEPAAIVRHLRNDSVGGMLGRSFRLGRGSGRLRWQLGLRGAVFARHVYLAPLLAPLLIGLSCLRTLCRAPHAVFSVILFSPAEIASAVSYTAGFIVGALQARRDAPSGPAPAPNA